MFQGVPRAATYAASKAFVQTFGEAIRHELAADGIDVTVGRVRMMRRIMAGMTHPPSISDTSS